MHDAVMPHVRTPTERLAAGLTWLGGGQRADLPERDERAAFALGGAVVVLVAILAGSLAGAAVLQATSWPWPAAFACGVPFGLLVGAVTRAVAGAPALGASRTPAGRIAVAIVVGLLVGELASTVLFAGEVDRRLSDQAQLAAAEAPAVQQAHADLDQARADRVAIDVAVETARARRDEALVTARCEFHPGPECPQTRITGVPGSGPETMTANELLREAQAEFDAAVADRATKAALLDATVAARETEAALLDAKVAARATATQPDTGLGDRWAAMNSYTLAHPSTLGLRLLDIAVASMLVALPLLLRRWRGETTQDRRLAARAAQDRARQEAETAIVAQHARAWVTAARVPEPEALPASEMLPPARVLAAASQPEENQMTNPRPGELVHSDSASADSPILGSLPAVTRAATRWVRPLVPSIVANAVDSAVNTAVDTARSPIRRVRQVVEEVEEITFTLKRTHRVTVHTEEMGDAVLTSDGARYPVGRFDGSVPIEGTVQGELDTTAPRRLPPAE